MNKLIIILLIIFSVSAFGQRSENDLQKKFAVSTYTDITAANFPNLDVGDRIKVEDTGAEYILKDTIDTGYNGDVPDLISQISVRDTTLFAIIQPINGEYRYSHLYRLNSTTTFALLFDLSAATGIKGVVDGSGGTPTLRYYNGTTWTNL